MTAKQWALYRYLTLWADFTPAEALAAVLGERKRAA